MIRVAVLCERSGVVRDAFIRAGHDAVSYDLAESSSPGPHILGDCRQHDLSWADLVIAHPPCTRLCNSGVRWLHERNLWNDMREAAAFFRWCMRQGKRCAVENPIPHRHATIEIGEPYTQVVQPWMFGHGETKATCLWLRGLPPLVPTNVVDGRVARVHRESPGPDRWMRRSLTYTGIAEAMAAQWGAFVLSQCEGVVEASR